MNLQRTSTRAALILGLSLPCLGSVTIRPESPAAAAKEGEHYFERTSPQQIEQRMRETKVQIENFQLKVQRLITLAESDVEAARCYATYMNSQAKLSETSVSLMVEHRTLTEQMITELEKMLADVQAKHDELSRQFAALKESHASELKNRDNLLNERDKLLAAIGQLRTGTLAEQISIINQLEESLGRKDREIHRIKSRPEYKLGAAWAAGSQALKEGTEKVANTGGKVADAGRKITNRFKR